MQIVLLESAYNSINSQIDTFYRKYPKSCRIYVSKKVDPEQLKGYKEPPLISSGWLFVVSDIVPKRVLISLVSQPINNVVIYRVTSNKSARKLTTKLKDLNVEFKYIDNLNLSEEEIKEVIKRTVKCDSDTTVDYIISRFGGNFHQITLALHQLAAFQIITKSIVKKYTTKENNVPIFKLANHLLKVEEDPYSAMKVISQYRYAASYLIEYLRGVVNDYILVFGFIHDGQLSEGNVQEFVNDTNNQALKEMSSFSLQKIVESYGTISWDYLFFLKYYFEKLSFDLDGLLKISLLI